MNFSSHYGKIRVIPLFIQKSILLLFSKAYVGIGKLFSIYTYMCGSPR